MSTLPLGSSVRWRATPPGAPAALLLFFWRWLQLRLRVFPVCRLVLQMQVQALAAAATAAPALGKADSGTVTSSAFRFAYHHKTSTLEHTRGEALTGAWECARRSCRGVCVQCANTALKAINHGNCLTTDTTTTTTMNNDHEPTIDNYAPITPPLDNQRHAIDSLNLNLQLAHHADGNPNCLP